MSHLSQTALGNTETRAIRLRSRRWCFTLNNWTEVEMSQCLTEFDSFIIGQEVGENGTPHLQGYVEFKNQKDLSCLKKILSRAHWEKAKGSRGDNIAYCSKGGIYNTTFPEDNPLDRFDERNKCCREYLTKMIKCVHYNNLDWDGQIFIKNKMAIIQREIENTIKEKLLEKAIREEVLSRMP